MSTKPILYVGVVPLMVALTLYRAIVAAQLWGWFVVPLGAPAVSIAHAYGLLLLWGLCSARVPWADHEARKRVDNRLAQEMAFSVAVPSLGWGLGWVVQHFFL